jgi:hypothetical protein
MWVVGIGLPEARSTRVTPSQTSNLVVAISNKIVHPLFGPSHKPNVVGKYSTLWSWKPDDESSGGRKIKRGQVPITAYYISALTIRLRHICRT